MRWRVLVLVLVALNVALAIALSISLRHSAAKSLRLEAGLTNAAAPEQVQTKLVVWREFFSWQEIESDDYSTYIANLRDIGCPDATIHDIIVADVNALYARRRATEVITPGQQWWRTQPDGDLLSTAVERLRALDQERRALLTRLLGPNWEPVEIAATVVQPRTSVVLDGPVLGTLSAEVKQTVQDINARSQQRMQAYLEGQSQAGKSPDPVELDRLRQQTRDELAHVLGPAELEEYLLRYSQNANELRTELTQLSFFNATAEEFRSLFRARDNFDQQIKLLYSGTDDASVKQRQALKQQREAAIKNVLGPKRYAEYLRLQDPAYREATALAQQAGMSKSTETLYEIRQATAQEQQRIRSNTNLTAQQQEIELSNIQLEQLKANAVALGQESPPEPPAPPVPTIRHVVEAGESIDRLARRYDVSIREIIAANPGVDFNKVKPGDRLNVPSFPPAR